MSDIELDTILNYLNLNLPFDNTITTILKNRGLD